MTIRIDERDKLLIDSYSRQYGMTTSEFLRSVALERIEDEYDLELLLRAIQEADKQSEFYTLDEVDAMFEGQ
jgi:antitoxin component of RelBE/YafQ-DinJ toxin-antitoxin module